MFIQNAWYVAGWSSEFGRSLCPLVILGEDIVIYRKTDGSPAALQDACPHRKLPLSRGRLLGDTIECGYHGLTFDCAGKCVKAPTQKGLIPKNAMVHGYPVVDRWGLLWIWMGEPERANPDDIFHIDNFDHPSWGKTAGGTMEVECHYLYIIDNLLDPSHVAWVHASSFAGAGTGELPLHTQMLENGVLASRWVYEQPPPPYYADLLPFQGNCDRKQHYECQLPAIAINKSIYTPAGTGGWDKVLTDDAYINISYNFITPVDENNSRYFWFQHRNTDPDNEAVSQKMFAGAKLAFEEDREVLTRVHKGMAKSIANRTASNVKLKLDVGAVRYRFLVDAAIAAQSKDESKD